MVFHYYCFIIVIFFVFLFLFFFFIPFFLLKAKQGYFGDKTPLKNLAKHGWIIVFLFFNFLCLCCLSFVFKKPGIIRRLGFY